VDETLDSLCGRQSRRSQRLAETEARFAQLDTTEAHRADKELNSNELVETNSPSDDVPASHRQIRGALLLGEERLDFFCFYERDVLARFAMMVKVPVAFEPRACNDTDCAVLCVRATRRSTSEDSLNRHDGLSFDRVPIVSCRLTFSISGGAQRRPLLAVVRRLGSRRHP
jgi:hypothetical protein